MPVEQQVLASPLPWVYPLLLLTSMWSHHSLHPTSPLTGLPCYLTWNLHFSPVNCACPYTRFSNDEAHMVKAVADGGWTRSKWRQGEGAVAPGTCLTYLTYLTCSCLFLCTRRRRGLAYINRTPDLSSSSTLSHQFPTFKSTHLQTLPPLARR
jgi:hypothetical protein